MKSLFTRLVEKAKNKPKRGQSLGTIFFRFAVFNLDSASTYLPVAFESHNLALEQRRAK